MNRFLLTAGGLVFSLALTAGCGGQKRAAVVVAGSTSVQPYVEVLAEEYEIIYPEREVDIQGGGSSAGITAAESGTADIGMSSRVLYPEEQAMWSVEISKDGLAVIVHPDNPVYNLSLNEIRHIYSSPSAIWSDVGGSDHSIHVIAREEGSGTRSAFEDLVMGGVLITPKAIIQDSNGAVRQLVSNDINSIGFISLGLVDHTVKALQMDSIAPSWENVTKGDYTLFRPFLFITPEPPTGHVKEFIDFALSANGQGILASEGLIPAAEGTNR